MKKGELHWETLAKLIIMIVIIVIIVYLIFTFRDRMYFIVEKLRENI